MVIRHKTLASSSLAFSDRSIDIHQREEYSFYLSFLFSSFFFLVEFEGQEGGNQDLCFFLNLLSCSFHVPTWTCMRLDLGRKGKNNDRAAIASASLIFRLQQEERKKACGS